MKIIIRSADGSTQDVEAQPGDLLMEVIRNAGIAGIEAECGGCLTCGTCAVDIDADWFAKCAPADEAEAELLEYGINPGPTMRLSCQVALAAEMHGLSLSIPATQR